MNQSERAIEEAIIAAGKTASRLRPEDIDERVEASYYMRASDIFGHLPMTDKVRTALSCLTIGVVVSDNGFTLVGESACVSPDNFDPEIGGAIAVSKAREKLWALEGYLLREVLYRGKLTLPGE
jgi:hypothetical protein